MAKKKNETTAPCALEVVMEERFPKTIVESWYEIDVSIKHHLSAIETLQFVKEVVDGCFLEDGTYVPELRDFYQRTAILEYYTDLDLPDNAQRQYDIVYGTDVCDFVMSYIDASHFKQMSMAIDTKIQYQLDVCAKDIQSKFNGVLQELDSLGDQFEALFKNISPSDIQNVVDAIGNNGVDESKIVSAYMEQLRN